MRTRSWSANSIEPGQTEQMLNFYFSGWSLGYIKKLTCSGLPTYSAQKYQTCTEIALLGYQFRPWSSGDSEIHFLCPEKFTLGHCRIQTMDLSICSRTRYQSGPMSPFYVSCRDHSWGVNYL